MICAEDEFFAFIDGWRGKVAGFNNGHAEVKCLRADTEDGVLRELTFFVPVRQLRLDLGAH